VNVFIPTLLTSNSSTVCDGSAITLTANAGPGTSTYSWSNGSNFNSSNVTATVAAVYTVTAHTSITGSVSNCISTATIAVGINPNPTITVSSTRTLICKGEKTKLSASGGSTYAWTSLSPTTPTVQVGPTTINNTTTYTVTGTDANGCSSFATIGVRVVACTGIGEIDKPEALVNIYPNPSNGNFVIQVKTQMHLSLVNELGQVIRELNFSEGNNYLLEIHDLSNGIYFIKGLNEGSAIQNKIIVNK